MKYTEHGYISVECRAFDEPMGLRTAENVAVEIIVSDTGCGIPAERLECIFREFEQVESTEQRTPTQGLGKHRHLECLFQSLIDTIDRSRSGRGCTDRGAAWWPTPS